MATASLWHLAWVFSPQHNVAQVLPVGTLMPSGSPILLALFNPSCLPNDLWGSYFHIQIGRLSFQPKNLRWIHSNCIKEACWWNEFGLSSVILPMWFCCKSFIVGKILRCLLLWNTKYVRFLQIIVMMEELPKLSLTALTLSLRSNCPTDVSVPYELASIK